MKTIRTKDGDIFLDDDDFDFLTSFFSISVNRSGGVRLMVNAVLPRVIMKMRKGDGLIVDHINGNPLDNRKVNLRIVTSQQNICNSAKRHYRGTMSSKYKGVHRLKSNGKWKTAIKHCGEVIRLGHYKSEEFAAYMYDYAACNLHGQYARTNGLYVPPSPNQFGLKESA